MKKRLCACSESTFYPEEDLTGTFKWDNITGIQEEGDAYMTVNQMQYFVTLCREKSFSKAAEALYITQPAMSRQIAAMEEELDTQLIVRNRGKAFAVTPAGERYYRVFERFLTEKENLDFLLKNFEIENNVVYRIGLMAGWYLPDVIASCSAAVKECFPDVELQFEFYLPDKIRELMQKKTLDAVVMIEEVHVSDDSYETRFIRDLYSVYFVSAKHPAVVNGRIDPSRIRGPFVTQKGMSEGRPARFQLERIINNHKVIIREMDSIESVSQNILASEGVSIADEWSAPCFLKEYAAEILPDFQVHVILACRKEDDPVFLKIVDILEEQLKKYPEKK